jgi:methionyl-tRNA formyltransferase
MKYSIAIAGTTIRTRQCAQVLLNSPLFEISFIITPVAKPVGRKQIITPNPMEVFARENNIPIIFVEKKLDENVRDKVEKFSHNEHSRPDLLLVVDFGYIVPNWLLQLPKIVPLNIHPSQLPKWRGSSPGQFAILFNEKKSAVTLMVVDEKLDHGPIIHQDFFDVDKKWNQSDYYEHAFNLMCTDLDKKIAKFAQNPKKVTSQPEESPTITAKMIKKEETFVPWSHVQMAMKGLCPINLKVLSGLLQSAYKNNGLFPLTLERASKAFNPWPNLWTILPTKQGEKRMKILEADLSDEKLILTTVHIEGKNPGKWEEIKNSTL